MQSNYTVPIAIVIGGIILAAAIYISIANRLPGGGGARGDATKVRPVDSTDHILGNPAAPVKIVEYSDFECSYCKAFHQTLTQLIAAEGADGEVAWVFRHFPLFEIHKDAVALAQASECAAKVGGNAGFFKFADELFADQPAKPAKLGAYAAAAGLPSEAFASCYADREQFKERVNNDRINAMQLGAGGTPYSLILVEGKTPVVLDGAYSYDALKQLVEQALAPQ